MGFSLYKKDTVKFEIDGAVIEMDVNRLSAKESMQIALKSSRIEEELNSNTKKVADAAKMASVQLQVDLLADIVTDIRGIDDLPDYPADLNDRKKIFGADFRFLTAAMSAYSDSSTPKNEEEAEGK